MGLATEAHPDATNVTAVMNVAKADVRTTGRRACFWA
jgi:hypothetical protein